ncbi:Transporter of the ATP-binding cassette (ABC), partial [Coemansia sp. RSA 2607]
MSRSDGPQERQPLTGGSDGIRNGSKRGVGQVLGHAATRACTVLCIGVLLWSALQHVMQTDTASCARQLSSECFRLGVLWPLVNVALSIVLLVRLALQPWEPVAQSANDDEQAGAALELHDNRTRIGWLGTAASVAAGANALAMLVQQRTEQPAYWASGLALWAAAAVLTARQTLGVRRGTEAAQPLFPGVLVAALLAHTCMATLAEGFYMATQAGEPADGVGRVVGGLLALVALLLALSAHRTGFLLPRAPRTADDVGERAADATAYATALSRGRAEHEPLVRTPERAASVLGALAFSWVTPILRMGTRTTIGSGDLYVLDAADRPLSIWRSYTECRRPGRALLRTLLATFASQLLAQVLLALAAAVLAYAGPFFLQRILRALGSGERGRGVYGDAAALLLASLAHSLATNQVLWLGRKVSLRLQSLLVAELSACALQRRSRGCSTSTSAEAEKDTEGDSDNTAGSDGRMANMLTSDLESVSHIASYLDELYTLPIGFVLGAWYLHRLLGTAALIGLSATAAYYPLTRLLVRHLVRLQRKLMALDDERVTMITEVFQGIRAVKLFGWQTRFVARVGAKRDEEIAAYWRLVLLQLPVSFVRVLITSLILVGILAIHTLGFGGQLTADIVFP